MRDNVASYIRIATFLFVIALLFTINCLLLTSNQIHKRHIYAKENGEVKLAKNYTLSNHKTKKESRLAKKFKGSILGADIGVKSSGFSSVAILATVIALAAALVMYFIWRF